MVLSRWKSAPGLAAIFAAALSSIASMFGLALASEAAKPTPEQLQFFETKVRPILVANCHKCHSGKEPKGDLGLDSRGGLLAGGESGEVVVPGQPEKSLLVEAINRTSIEMPPDKKLADADIATLTEWVKLGAPWPEEPGGNGPTLRKSRGKITDEDRSYWAFQPVRKTVAPEIEKDVWSRGSIDRFLLAKMIPEGLRPAAEADKATLIRRSSFDLLGLPPSPEEVAAFVNDQGSDAYERLIDRLLASPQYGERWARHWLDLVRYAESDGYKQDGYRPSAWRYRDYVIRSLNIDKPYDRFVQEQIAGDEIAPEDPEALVATGYYRLGIYEYNQRDVRNQWNIILNDVTDVTADVFLGMGMSCARCHDHKFDPILQKDYYRLQAFFAPIIQRDDVPAATPRACNDYREKLKAWEEQSADLRRQIDEIEKPHVDAAAKAFIAKFPVDIEPIFSKPENERTPLEAQLVRLAGRQIIEEGGKVDFTKKLKGDEKTKWEGLKKQLAEQEKTKPQPLPEAMMISDVGPVGSPVTIPGKRNAEEIAPGAPSVIDPAPLEILQPSTSLHSTGRRTALAQWLTRADNPLTPRVMVNRIWQYHFGKGLVESSSDFGRLGQPPSHPELLDNLAADFVNSGWSMKDVHRRLLGSAAYRQVAHGPGVNDSAAKDPGNKWMSRMTVRRLGAEQIRDAALTATGEIDGVSGGPGSDNTSSRRSVYLKVMRNKRDDLLDVFDVPDGSGSIPERNVTTTPTQSLLMMNGPWMLARAKALATRVERENGSATREQKIAAVYGNLFGRTPTADESATATAFLGDGSSKERLIDLCHVLLNSSEFLYVD
ncbi:MAG: PSD1 domain-containing protein [Pirellulaceae bacterium]|nr:PSD1 domain-containing protein [Pirellulaceae bacterium]